MARPLRVKAKRRTGTASFIRHGVRLPRFHCRGPIEDSLQALATKTRMGRHVRAWWRRPQARKEHSSPTLLSPGGLTPNLLRRTIHCPSGVRGGGSDCLVAVTWSWLTRAMLPGHRDPPVSPLGKGGKGLYRPYARWDGDFAAYSRWFGQGLLTVGVEREA